MKKKPTPTHGGARAGAGRKSIDGATDLVKVGLTIRKEQREALAALGGSAWLRAVLDHALTETKLSNAAIRWWQMRRPLSFTAAQHLADPAVNMPTDADKALAAAVAMHIQCVKPKRA